MQWSMRSAHLPLQVRAAVLNGDLRERFAYKPLKTSVSIEDRVDVRTGTAVSQGGVTPQLIYRSLRARPRNPRDKPKVEHALIVERWMLGS
jgi:hypothetical protein